MDNLLWLPRVYYGNRGYRNRTGKIWYVHISVSHVIKIHGKNLFGVIKKILENLFLIMCGKVVIIFPEHRRDCERLPDTQN